MKHNNLADKEERFQELARARIENIRGSQGARPLATHITGFGPDIFPSIPPYNRRYT